MSENLFLISTYNLMDETIKFNKSSNLKKSLEDNNFNQGSFFYFNKNTDKLYYSKIKSVIKLKESEINESNEFSCNIKLNNLFYRINFESNPEIKSKNILKNIYAKRNKKFIGDKTASLYYSLDYCNFNYSFPIIDEINFQNGNPLIEEILYGGSIIPSPEEESKNFARIVNEDGYYFLSLMNELMLEKDFRFLVNEDINGAEYRPYFYEFYLNENQNDRLKNYIDKGIYTEDKLYKIELYSLKNEKTIKNNLQDQNFFKGEIMFSASPIRSIPAYLKIIETEVESEVLRKIKNIDYFINEKANLVKERSDIETTFMKTIKIPDDILNLKYEIKIFNVGQGNWIHINIYSYETIISKIIFDIGVGNRIEKELRDSITSQASQEIVNDCLFILSHWDLDHIKGITELHKSQFEKTWIVPEIPEKASQSAKRLAAYLIIGSNIETIFVPNSLNGEIIFKNEYFEFGKGYGNGKWHSCHLCKDGCRVLRKDISYTAENNLGLILVIKTEDKKMLFPGDCEYIQFPRELVHRNYDALVASHHGATIKQKDLKALGFVKSGKDKFAVVCVGKKHSDINKSYPKISHEKSIRDLGFKLHKTRDYTVINSPCKYILD